MLTICYGYQDLQEQKMYRVVLKEKFKERPINLSRVVKIMFNQKFSGSIRKEHITWWKQYWIKPIYLEILYPKKGWITLVKIYREGKPSIRVITTPTSSTKRELLVYNKLYGKEE
jgi:ubiquinone/menaquinone biosynthesis C-methylase UbiE